MSKEKKLEKQHERNIQTLTKLYPSIEEKKIRIIYSQVQSEYENNAKVQDYLPLFVTRETEFRLQKIKQ